jgi:hypothetical protein
MGTKVARSLADTARTTGTPQGQWMNNAAAAELIGAQGIIKGVTEFPIPPGLGRVFMPDGRILNAVRGRIVPGGGNPQFPGLKSAFPILE